MGQKKGSRSVGAALRLVVGSLICPCLLPRLDKQGDLSLLALSFFDTTGHCHHTLFCRIPLTIVGPRSIATKTLHSSTDL
jgi:hypothetical protein